MVLATLNRWFGSPQPQAEAKAATGPGVWSLSTLPQLNSISNSPVKKIAEAQTLFRSNPWVAQAERAINGKYVNVGWHLEDSQGDTVKVEGQPAQAIVDLLDPDEEKTERLGRVSLWSLTLRHMGLTGNAFWYLDQLDTLGSPLDIVYINPARMTPVQTDAGKLLGWIMDGPDNPVTMRMGLRTAVPFERRELRHFKLDEPDWGHYGIGIAEAAWNQIQLDEAATQHLGGVFAAGGRIAGLVSPKVGTTMNDDAWMNLVREWRNITADPDAAKRLLISKGPVDFTSTAAKPNELEMEALLRLSRSNVFAAWGVNEEVGAGIVGPVGLNSGDKGKYQEAALWQGPIDYRRKPFEKKVQSVIDTFGLGLKLVIEAPSFDDQAPLFVNAEKAVAQPLTNDERRAMLGLDPLDDKELGAAIFIASTMTKLTLEDPVPQPFGVPPSRNTEDEGDETGATGDAPGPVKAKLRTDAAEAWQAPLREFLAGQATTIANRVKNNHKHLVSKPSDSDVWWNERQWNRELGNLLDPLLTDLGTAVALDRGRQFTSAKADAWVERVLEVVRRSAAARITAINRTTRDAIARLIASGLEAGLGPSDLADTIRGATSFNEARAELIARTESATAYNEAALGTYRHFDVAQVTAIDGDHDEECAARDGNTYTIDEASGITDHPNGTLDWIPVVAKAKVEKASVTVPEIHLTANIEMPKPDPVNVTVNVPQQLPPVVNVPKADAPQVTVNVPEQPTPIVNVPAAKAVPVQKVEVVTMPPRAHKAVRNAKGEVTGSTEVDL